MEIGEIGSTTIRNHPEKENKKIFLIQRIDIYGNRARSLVALFNHHYFTDIISWEREERTIEKEKNHAFVFKNDEGVAINIATESDVDKINDFFKKNKTLFAFVMSNEDLVKHFINDGVELTIREKEKEKEKQPSTEVNKGDLLGKIKLFFRGQT